MHAQQLSNLMSMLKLNDQTAQSTQQKQTELKKLQEETEKTKLQIEEAEKAIEKANGEVNSAKKEQTEAQKQREEADRKRVIQERDFLAKKKELDRKDMAVKQRTTHIMGLRDKLIELARNLVKSSDSTVASLGQEILKESFLEAENLLAAYAKHPGPETAEPLSELVGSSEEALEAALPKGLGFAFWQKYSMKDGSKTAYVGVVRQTAETDEGIVLITVTEKKVEDIDVFPLGLSVAFWDPDDWSKPVAYNLYLRPNGEAGIDRFVIKGDRWTVPDTETDFLDEGPPKKVYGVEKPLYFMKLDDFKTKHAEIYKAAAASNREGFSTMVAMLENEKIFNANKITELAAGNMLPGLRETFVQLLTESIKRTKVKGVEIASASNLKLDVYGLVAAMALKPGFKIEGIRPSPASTSTKSETCGILCEYRPFDEGIKHGRLTFTRDSPEGKWMLLNFEPSVALSLTSAE
jgi:myosin heavy subunit